MRPFATTQESGSYIVVAFTIWIELACGLEATTWTAFYNNPKNKTLPYLLFGIYLLFTLTLIYLTGRELCARLKRTGIKSQSLNWLWVFCTPLTLGVFLLLFNHNSVLTAELASVKDYEPPYVLDKAYHVIVFALVLFPCFYMVCTSASPEQLPFLIFLVWIQLVAAMTVTVPTVFEAEMKGTPSLIFACVILFIVLLVALHLASVTFQEICCLSKRNNPNVMKFLYVACRFCTVITGLLFGVMWSYHGSLLTVKIYYAYAFAVYFYSCYFHVLLELLPNYPLIGGARPVAECSNSETEYELGPV
ncbi:hypothetical protein Ocin01_13548 [Orchesella cincta]|uniref:Transmembrane protein n=1 Tax=Orchesella cincta TaxID=48709 RepID=A0A1D2MJG4_ORCCI|nr:hypothetical protein Ocin01_13548 [Orchesella cincta]